MEHTKGPWKTPTDSKIPQHIIHHEGINGYITVCYLHIHNDKEVTQANCKLIAAAPDLLEALKLFIKQGRTLLMRDAQGKIEDSYKEFANFIGAVIEHSESAINKAKT